MSMRIVNLREHPEGQFPLNTYRQQFCISLLDVFVNLVSGIRIKEVRGKRGFGWGGQWSGVPLAKSGNLLRRWAITYGAIQIVAEVHCNFVGSVLEGTGI